MKKAQARINAIEVKEPTYKLEDLNFNFNLKEADYQVDALQNQMLQDYIRTDARFRKAFYTNYTNSFLQFIKDKARLNEPIHLSVIGQVRSGKSTGMISVASLIMALYGKMLTTEYICGNVTEFIEKLKIMPEDKLRNSCFVIDEEKKAVFGMGSTARKMKVMDIQNIIAINNISTIMITPMSWANENAFYGLKAFGRCFKTGTIRFMLYNLQNSGGLGLPLGMVYLPRFEKFLPKVYAEILAKEYLAKKNEWVMKEMRGQGHDDASVMKQKVASQFLKDNNFLALTKRNDRIVYISMKLGNEWTKSEMEEMNNIIKLMQMGAIENPDKAIISEKSEVINKSKRVVGIDKLGNEIFDNNSKSELTQQSKVDEQQT